ncbi:patatin-like phospholipase domain-containing protein [Sporobolomyces koalae]|uniref:patatin-like phospholipase domain-containing protein n=1 Tax=Sporobolomyces koalae TaxID=500713 RepID=UPI003175FA2A
MPSDADVNQPPSMTNVGDDHTHTQGSQDRPGTQDALRGQGNSAAVLSIPRDQVAPAAQEGPSGHELTKEDRSNVAGQKLDNKEREIPNYITVGKDESAVCGGPSAPSEGRVAQPPTDNDKNLVEAGTTMSGDATAYGGKHTAKEASATASRSLESDPSKTRPHKPYSATGGKWDEWNEKACSMSEDWVDEEGVEVFRKALSDEVDLNSTGEPPIEKISSVSDFAPIKERVQRRPGSGSKRRRTKDVTREGFAYHLSRWPLLGLIFTIIFLEFLAYLLVRQIVNIIEWCSAWRGERGKLRVALRNAETFDEWKARALALDSHLGLDHWKRSPPNAYYDAPLVRRVLKALRELRTKQDVEGVCAVLHAVLKSNFAGTESFRLYSETYYGTKELVQEFIDEVTECLIYVRSLPPSILPLADKLDFFRSSSKNLGSSALCLSGGASFGYYHFGVIRALLDQGLLPRVVTGTSAGALVAAFICCRTDQEISQLLTPELADRITACSESTAVWLKRVWKTGARFDTIEWAKKASWFTLGSMTFKEAFERTGRILNVSVIPYDTHSPTKLLNYINAPECVIYTAVIASAAVPGIINPVVLLRKDKQGKLHPWEFQGRHKDGSLRVDIPLHALNLLYNVNFSLVSQVNPHVHLFAFSPRGAPGRPVAHRAGKGWRGGFLLSAAEQYLKIELMKNFRVIRDLELLPEFGGQNWSAVFLQKFEGSVTIWPKSRLKDWFRILTDPDRNELARMIRVGQTVTWPKIKMIENRLKIERQIDLGREELRIALAARSGTHSNPDRALPLPPFRHHGSSDFLHTSSSASASRSHSPHQLRNRHEVPTRDLDYDHDDEDFIGVERRDRDEDVQEEQLARDERDATPIYSTKSGQPVTIDNDEENHRSRIEGAAAERRSAILERLGLAVDQRDRENRNGNGKGKGKFARPNRDGEASDFTAESGAESTGSNVTGRLRRRRYSMGSVGRRTRGASLSTDEEGWR